MNLAGSEKTQDMSTAANNGRFECMKCGRRVSTIHCQNTIDDGICEACFWSERGQQVSNPEHNKPEAWRSPVKASEETPDLVNHPPHYTAHPSGIECIQITEHMNFNLGNAVKYLWRSDHKNGLEDLKKARWYVDREIARLESLTTAKE